MSEYEIEMIRVLDQMGNTDWVGIVFSVLVPILSALVVYLLTKKNIEVDSKNKYNLDVLKEKRMLATKIKLDKYESLTKDLIEYMSLLRDSYYNIYFLTEFEGHEDTFEKTQEIGEDLISEIDKKIINIEILTAYYSNIKTPFFETKTIYLEMKRMIRYGFLYNGDSNVLDKPPTFIDFKEKYLSITLQLTKIAETLTNAIIEITTGLESDLVPVSELSFLEKCKIYKNTKVVIIKVFCIKTKAFILSKIDDFKKVEQTKNIK